MIVAWNKVKPKAVEIWLIIDGLIDWLVVGRSWEKGNLGHLDRELEMQV